MSATDPPTPEAAPTAPETITCSDQQPLRTPRWLTVLLASTTDLVHATTHGYRATCTHSELQQLVNAYGPTPICDVCRAPWPRWTHAASTTATAATDDGSWLLCDACDDAKRTGDHQILLARMRRANLASPQLADLELETVEVATHGTLRTLQRCTSTERTPVPWLGPGAL